MDLPGKVNGLAGEGGTMSLRPAKFAGTAHRASTEAPFLYVRSKLLQFLLQLGYILLLVEGVFLAEKVNQILEATLDKAAGFGDIAWLLVLSMPDAFNIALPIAVLFAAYRVALGSREDRELLVLAGAGINTRQFMALMLGIGFAMQLCSLFVSGYVQPRAQFLARATQFAITYEALWGGNPAARLMQLPNEVVYVAPQAGKTKERSLFVQMHADGRPTRVISSEKASWGKPAPDGAFTLNLRDGLLIDFDRTNAPDQFPLSSVASQARFGSMDHQVDVSKLLPFGRRGQSANEWSMSQLLGMSAAPSAWSVEQVRELGVRFARSLLCLLAPVMAGLALIFTTRATHAVTLPVACATLMALDIAASTLVRTLATSGFSAIAIAAGLIAMTIALAASLGVSTYRNQERLIIPALARA